MKMPIPGDWDGVSECTYEVRWPDSTLWRIILRGLLSSPSLVDFWDQNTGNVAQVLVDFEPFLNFALSNLECGAMSVPVGTVLEFAGSTLPDKFLWADGSLVAIADEPDLFDVIGYEFGAGLQEVEGSFYLPNRKGRVAVGVDASQTEFNVLGKAGGAKTHTLTIAEIPNHTHTEESFDGGTPAAVTGQSGAGLNIKRISKTSGGAGGGQSHNNLQPYLAQNFIIRARK
ncbi:MAG: tail fiber protein [Anaerolineae bacterium]|nr:tail fiber protein [Anaerolineae bacterium]